MLESVCACADDDGRVNTRETEWNKRETSGGKGESLANVCHSGRIIIVSLPSSCTSTESEERKREKLVKLFSR